MWTGARQRLRCVTASAASAVKKAPTMTPRCATCTALENGLVGSARKNLKPLFVRQRRREIWQLASGICSKGFVKRQKLRRRRRWQTIMNLAHHPHRLRLPLFLRLLRRRLRWPLWRRLAPAPPIEQDVELDLDDPLDIERLIVHHFPEAQRDQVRPVAKFYISHLKSQTSKKKSPVSLGPIEIGAEPPFEDQSSQKGMVRRVGCQQGGSLRQDHNNLLNVSACCFAVAQWLFWRDVSAAFGVGKAAEEGWLVLSVENGHLLL